MPEASLGDVSRGCNPQEPEAGISSLSGLQACRSAVLYGSPQQHREDDQDHPEVYGREDDGRGDVHDLDNGGHTDAVRVV